MLVPLERVRLGWSNERSFPGRNTRIPLSSASLAETPSVAVNETIEEDTDTGDDLIGSTFTDDGETFEVLSTEKHQDEDGEHAVCSYKNQETGKVWFSSVGEVRNWVNNVTTRSSTNTLHKPLDLALDSYYKLQPDQRKAPASYNKAGNQLNAQWFRAEDKERHGILEFNTWQRIPQRGIPHELRKRALRAHHIYSVKRNGDAKNRVVVNGRRQHSSTYTDTTSPVATQLLLRTSLAIMALRCYACLQGDSSNAYLHAGMQDLVLIIIPDGFPRAGEVAILLKAQ